jgi:hypothetical protein
MSKRGRKRGCKKYVVGPLSGRVIIVDVVDGRESG